MQYTITFLGEDFKKLQAHLFQDKKEQAAYILCRLSVTQDETRFLVKEIIPVEQKNIIFNDSESIFYSCDSYLPIVHKALEKNECLLLSHSHINGNKIFSKKDILSEKPFLKYVYNRLKKGVHGSLVFSNENTFQGYVYDNSNDGYSNIDKLRIVDNTYKILNSVDYNPAINDINIYDRNILAFGEELQKLLGNFHAGVIGCGGTGSCLIEQLCRMGVSKITIIDHDKFEDTNTTRMHGSSINDVSKPKVSIMEEMANRIGLKTEIIPLNEKLDNPETTKRLRDCDIIFSCLDNTHYTRAILNLLSIYYYIPLIDMGINFYSKDGELKDIFGRIDVVTPNSSCLLCREVINPKTCSAEMMSPEEYQMLKKEGYAPELKTDKVQTISYNTLIASYAIIEMIQLLTNFKGSSLLHKVYRFNKGKITTEGILGDKRSDCICNKSNLGMGDVVPFLGMSW